MATELALPDLGEDINEADVLKVLIKVGEVIDLEQPVLEIETEKATLDVPASVAGEVTVIHVGEGDTIHPGDVIMTVDETASAAPASASPALVAAAPEPPPAESEPADPAPAPVDEDPAAAATTASEEAPAAPATAVPPATATPSAPPPPVDGERAPVFAAPSVRRFAREVGVPVHEVAGSGPGGRISEDDVKRHARDRAGATEGAAAPRAAIPLPDFSQFGAVEREPLSRLRRTIKRNMSTAWDAIPHVTLFHTADVTEMEAVRQQYKKRAEDAGGRMTVTAILLKIVGAALKAHPRVNSSLDAEADELILKDYVHIGVAVDTPRGLVVPVIRDVDQKNIIELAVQLTDVSERARENELTLEDFRGGTFAITNLGGMGTGHFTPIIQHPNAAILGVGRAENTPVWEEGQWVPRLILPLSFVFDHRVIDGADGARFMTWIAEAIAQPLVLAIEG